VIRGFRGATTVTKNEEEQMMTQTKRLVLEMAKQNQIRPEHISHVFFTVTDDLNAAFPAKVARQIDGWKYVPVMCMREIDVPGSLPLCIRVIIVAETGLEQDEIKHIFLNDAVKLRPDLVQERR